MEPLPSLLPDSPRTGLLPCIRPMIHSGEEVWLRLALLSPPPWPLCCPALPGKQEEADRFPLPAGPLYTEQNLGGVAGCRPWQLSTQTLWSLEGPSCSVLEGSTFRRGSRSENRHRCHDSRVQRWCRGFPWAPVACSLGCFDGQFC